MESNEKLFYYEIDLSISIPKLDINSDSLIVTDSSAIQLITASNPPSSIPNHSNTPSESCWNQIMNLFSSESMLSSTAAAASVLLIDDLEALEVLSPSPEAARNLFAVIYDHYCRNKVSCNTINMLCYVFVTNHPL